MALGALGERSVAPQLLELLADEYLDPDPRCHIARVLGTLGERSVAPQLLEMLADERENSFVRQGIAEALGALVTDEETVHALATLLLTSDVADGIHRTLWTLSRLIGVRIFVTESPEGKQIEVVKPPA